MASSQALEALAAINRAEPSSVSLDKLDRAAHSLRTDAASAQRSQSHRQSLEALGIKLWNACGGLSLDVEAWSRVAALRHVAAWLFYVSAPDEPTYAEHSGLLSVLATAADALLGARERHRDVLMMTGVKRFNDAQELLHKAAEVR